MVVASTLEACQIMVCKSNVNENHVLTFDDLNCLTRQEAFQKS
jgi:hypothetical protein